MRRLIGRVSTNAAAFGLLLAFGSAGALLLVAQRRPVAINVRWDETIADADRASLEARFRLNVGERREASTWQDQLADRSRANIEALVRHPAADDTHNIDRERYRLVALPWSRSAILRDAALVGLAGGALVRL